MEGRTFAEITDLANVHRWASSAAKAARAAGGRITPGTVDLWIEHAMPHDMLQLRKDDPEAWRKLHDRARAAAWLYSVV